MRARILRRLSSHCVVLLRAVGGFNIPILAFVLVLVLLASGAYVGNGRQASADDPTPTPTSEPCQGVCVEGLWSDEYYSGVTGTATHLIHQSGPSTLWGDVACSDAAIGSMVATFSGSLDQATLQSTIVFHWQLVGGGEVTTTLLSTFSADGNTSTSTYQNEGALNNAGTVTAWRVSAHYVTRVAAASGGELVTGFGDTLTFPPNALPEDQDVVVDIGALPTLPPSNLTPFTRAYMFSPSGLEFSGPVTFVLRYTDADLAANLDPQTLRVYIYDPEHQAWDFVGGTVDAVARTITVQLNHFSTYAVFGQHPGEPPLPTPTPTPTPTQTFTPTPTPTRTPWSGAVGGIADYPNEPGPSTSANHSSPPNSLALGGLASGAILLLTVGGWYAGRRRLS